MPDELTAEVFHKEAEGACINYPPNHPLYEKHVEQTAQAFFDICQRWSDVMGTSLKEEVKRAKANKTFEIG